MPEWFRYNAGLLATQRDAVLPSDGPYLTYQRRTPLGVCGIITPFNHPMLILARSLSAALATGNTVVVKPSELTPLTTLALVDILYAAGLPEGVVSVVTGGRVAGERLTRHPDVAKITLTGGTEAGRAAAIATASRFARVTAELGGKTPIIVFDDIDPRVAAEGAAFAAFVAAGQSLLSTTSAPRAWATAATASMSKHASSGLVGVSSQTIAVSAGQSRRGRRRRCRSTAVHGSRAGPRPWRSGGTCRRRRRCRADPIARRAAGAARCPRRPGRWRRPGRGGRLERGDARLQRGAGGVAAARVLEALVAADAVLGERRATARSA